MGCQIFSTKILQDSYKNINRNDEFEHVTLHIRRNPKKYKQMYLLPQKKLSWTELGLTLDEKKDYLLLKKIIEYFGKNTLFKCEDVINLLNKKKKWIKLNSKVKRKENYIKI